MTAPDSRDSVAMRLLNDLHLIASQGETPDGDGVTVNVQLWAEKWADRLQALARGPQQAGGLDVSRIEAPTGFPARAWTEREKHDCREAMQRIVEREAQAGGEDWPEKVVAWMNECEAWRSSRAPSEPGTHALVLADDYAALQAEVARLREQAEHLRSMYRNACKELALANEATLQARAALREAGRDARTLAAALDGAFAGIGRKPLGIFAALIAKYAALNGGQDDAT